MKNYTHLIFIHLINGLWLEAQLLEPFFTFVSLCSVTVGDTKELISGHYEKLLVEILNKHHFSY